MTTSDPFSGSSSSTDENSKFDSPPSTDLSSSTNENSDYSHPSTDSSSTAANENSNKGSPFRDFSLSTNDGSSKSVPSLSSHSSDSSPPPPGPSNTIAVPLLTPLRFDSPPVRPVPSSSPPTSPPLSVATSPQSPTLLPGKSNKVKPSPALSSPSISSPNSSHLLTSPPQLDVDSSQPSVPSQTVSPPGYNPTEISSSIARPSGVTNRVPLSSSASRSNEPSRGDSGTGSILGVTFAGVVVIAFVIMVFLISRKRRKIKSYMDYHRHPDGIVSVTSGGYYYGQKSAMHPTHSGSYHSMTPPMSYGLNSSYGNYGGYGFQSSSTEPSSLGNSKSWFTYEELMNITNGFSDQNLLGEGGFGCVYKGQLPEGKLVAVKQLKSGSGQGEREFKAEVEIISRVHHRNLVSLVGYCIADHHRLLVYEFVPNNTLEHHLHGKGLPVMEWSKRITIAIGAARGLAYLHEDCHPRIIHRDIKSANILLDNSFEAQVADFGLAKLSNDTNTHVSTRVMGTFGYMAPEYASSGKLTDRSDVFSFGVVLLELLTGLRAIDSDQRLGDESLVEWARPLLIHALETGDYKELVDPRLENNYVESEMMRVIETAAACVRHSAPKRPRMIQVARSLDCEEEVSDLTSGIKLGQSAIFEANQRQTEMERFRQLALGTSEFPIKD